MAQQIRNKPVGAQNSFPAMLNRLTPTLTGKLDSNCKGPRANGNGSADARQSADLTPPCPDGPRVLTVPLETAQRRTANLQKQLRAHYRRESRRQVDTIMAIDARTAGAMFDLSERAWRRLDVTGQVPAPIRVGRSVRWRLKELAAWVRAGCPDRETWEAR